MPSSARALLAGVFALLLVLPVGAAAAEPSGEPSPSRAAALDPGLPTEGSEAVRVVVSGSPGAGPAVAAAVEAAGGSPGVALPLVDGLAATVPARRLPALAEAAAVRAVTADRRAPVLSTGAETSAPSVASHLQTTGATAAWERGSRGEGVAVAVLDTGVSPMADFDGRLVHGPDLSGEGRALDTHGHGTTMAGLIAGSGADSGGVHAGVAPEATVVSVKVAGRNGAVDVSTVLQGLHWVSAYAEQYGIRVLNLSWGVPSTQDPAVDPLDYAVERLWEQGVVVVVAGGNAGPDRRTVTKPADSPTVLTVGALDDAGDLDPANDSVPLWSSRGPTVQGVVKPDVVAPGRSLVSSRSFGSAVEEENPEALVAPSYITGSGSSQAAAVTSGLAALLLDARPELTPDQVKGLLTTTASRVRGADRLEAGAGQVSLASALDARAGRQVTQRLAATGLGSIEQSRGGRHVATECDGEAVEIVGEIDVRCEPWDPEAWTGSSWTGSSWTGSSWTGSSWTGSSWTGSSWTGSSWTGSSWTGSSWTGSSWTGSSWTGSSWTGSSWTGSSWTAGDFGTAFYGSGPPADRPLPGERSRSSSRR
jgi:serine protease AprX